MHLKNCSSEHINDLRQLYLSAFPKAERKPFWFMLQKAARGKMEILEIDDDGAFEGLVITAVYKDLVLVDYFAVSETLRCGGIGSQVLGLILDRYPNRRVFGEIEIPTGDENDNIKIRRKGFYLRNSAKQTGVLIDLFGVPMEILVFGDSLTYDEYIEFYRKVMGRAIASRIRLIEDKS